ncbi:DUF4350 domain-containing protein [Paraglaciecola sp.]|uniref:DUF4350 domain-containing protein n=1 Tax=Paraglaciecola sp. TaxID=1920173 RepID=UPI0030F47C47
MKFIWKFIFLNLVLFNSSSCSDNAQKADPDFIPKNTKTTFSDVNSPIVFLDEAHSNFHTANGRYKPFVQVLTSDGYTVKPSKEKFTLEYLKQADILVIANALDKNRQDWTPPFSDAFDTEEVEAVIKWVFQGGSLFLIADHIPFPRVSEKLSTAFGFEFSNGHVGNATFHIDNNSLMEHAIIRGNSAPHGDGQLEVGGQTLMKIRPYSEPIVQVKTFGGSAFQMPEDAKPLLILGKDAISLMPDIPFQVNAETPRISMDGWYQGAVLEVGEGRVAVFAEAMMFTSQMMTSTGKKYGLVSEGAEQNEQFLLNVMHWLSKYLD